MILEKYVWGDSHPPDGTIVREAYRYSHKFLKEYAKIEEHDLSLSLHCSPPGCTALSLMEFLEDNGIYFVSTGIGVDDYASWIIPIAPGGQGPEFTRIAIDLTQIEVWSKVTGLPDNVQLSRIMIHEFAHKLFHKRLVEGQHHYSGRAERSFSSALEEEEAWVFAFIFLALVMGDYSRVSRLRVGVDNTPARFI